MSNDECAAWLILAIPGLVLATMVLGALLQHGAWLVLVLAEFAGVVS